MFPPPSFTRTLFVSALCLSFFSTTNAQSPQSIQNISTNPTIDLYKMYNGDSFLDPGIAALFRWEYYNDKGPIARAFSTFNESIEIMAGTAESASNEVVDVAATNIVDSTATYYYPASLPLGLYHARINSTVNTTTSTDGFNIQQLTACSHTVNVTTSSRIGCGPNVPAPFTRISSPSASSFTSLYIRVPAAGTNAVRKADADVTDRDALNIQWEFRDQRNTLSKGISNVTIQILDNLTSAPVGPVITTDLDRMASAKYKDVPMKLRGSYKIELKYRNEVPDGTVKPGDVVTYTSQDFNVVLFEDFANDCANTTTKSSNSNSTSNPESSGKPNSGSELLVGWHHAALFGFLGIVSYFV